MGGALSTIQFNFHLTVVQGCQIRDFIPRSQDFLRLMGFFSETFSGKKSREKSREFSGKIHMKGKTIKTKIIAATTKVGPFSKLALDPSPLVVSLALHHCLQTKKRCAFQN